jgi:hypothetical protein
MPSDLASANANRAYSMAGTSIAIFTFMLVFLYPRFESGQLDSLLFQSALVVMGLATFASVVASFHYYGAALEARLDEPTRAMLGRRGDLFWFVGYSLLFLAPCLVLFGIGLVVVGGVWLALWIGYMVFALVNFPRVVTRRDPRS